MDRTCSADDGSDPMRLADALCARLCHDLSSPLGTLMGALEMMAEDPSAIEDALPIARETAIAMAARLRLLRAAWAGDCGPLSVPQLAELTAGLPPRVRADLTGLRGPFDGPVARCLLNLMLMAVEALPRGGVVSLATADAGILVSIQGKGAAWPPDLAMALIDPSSVPIDNPRAVQPPVAVMLAQAAGRPLSVIAAANPDAETPPPLLLAGN